MLSSVIIIDDDIEMRKMLSEVLSDAGYSVETAENANNAIKICRKLPFDVALVDIELPDIKGPSCLSS